MASETLEEDIHQAFHRAELPVRPERFSENARFPEDLDGVETLWGKAWPELTFADFDRDHSVFAFLPPDAVPYYLGAALVLGLKAEGDLPLALDMYLSGLATRVSKTPGKPSHALRRSMVAPLNRGQREVLLEFATWVAEVTGAEPYNLERLERNLNL